MKLLCITAYDKIVGVLVDVAVSVDITSDEWYITREDKVDKCLWYRCYNVSVLDGCESTAELVF